MYVAKKKQQKLQTNTTTPKKMKPNRVSSFFFFLKHDIQDACMFKTLKSIMHLMQLMLVDLNIVFYSIEQVQYR